MLSTFFTATKRQQTNKNTTNMTKFNITYRKKDTELVESYSEVIITGYYSSEDEGVNIGYQALVPQGEHTRWARFDYDGILKMEAAL